MEPATVIVPQGLIEKLSGWFSETGLLFNAFTKSNKISLDAKLLHDYMQSKKINYEEVRSFFQALPEDEWSVTVFLEHAAKANQLFGITEEEIRNKSVAANLSAEDVAQIQWELEKLLLQEAKKTADEYYDAIKIVQNPKFPVEKSMLLNEILLTLKAIKDGLTLQFNKYSKQTYNTKTQQAYNRDFLPILFLWFRLMHTILNVQTKPFTELEKMLALERIALMHQLRIPC